MVLLYFFCLVFGIIIQYLPSLLIILDNHLMILSTLLMIWLNWWFTFFLLRNAVIFCTVKVVTSLFIHLSFVGFIVFCSTLVKFVRMFCWKSTVFWPECSECSFEHSGWSSEYIAAVWLKANKIVSEVGAVCEVLNELWVKFLIKVLNISQQCS